MRIAAADVLAVDDDVPNVAVAGHPIRVPAEQLTKELFPFTYFDAFGMALQALPITLRTNPDCWNATENAWHDSSICSRDQKHSTRRKGVYFRISQVDRTSIANSPDRGCSGDES